MRAASPSPGVAGGAIACPAGCSNVFSVSKGDVSTAQGDMGPSRSGRTEAAASAGERDAGHTVSRATSFGPGSVTSRGWDRAEACPSRPQSSARANFRRRSHDEPRKPRGCGPPGTMCDGTRVGHQFSRADQTPEGRRGGRKSAHPLSIGRIGGSEYIRGEASAAGREERRTVTPQRSSRGTIRPAVGAAGQPGLPEHDGPEHGGGFVGSGFPTSDGEASSSSTTTEGSRSGFCRESEAQVV